ncbi:MULTISPECIES: ribosome maturation factor RimM [Proteiniclasticum]|jgi:16S rRNA processing protein RimM|uniref:Ribosome maturation factor RimM n=1 Tax=Proteiniclasticum ruminis TaxID=398199 RepID=A0A1I4YFM0_9CLOT|nr:MULTISPECIES: ribosome maturation factor RimM [Proteiniclasticum]SFN36400.1 16S rRNA processing protein RimM [Proteiniclasticum ruminis]HBW12472.1 16S rRNA processing protein RimM [Proteiniclasticum sp.]
MKKFLTIGEITKPHGIKGEVKVFPLTDDIQRFKKLKRVFIDGQEVKVSYVTVGHDRAILRLEGVDSVEEAEKLRKKLLVVPREEAVKLEEDSYFIEDLKDCTVYDEEGLELGKVADVIQTGANDVYWIKKPKELLIPAIRDVVLSVDVEAEKIIIKPIRVWSDED